jgi:hypothetical protein
LKKVTLSTSPAICSDGVRDWGTEAVILMEVYAASVALGTSNEAVRCIVLLRRLGRMRIIAEIEGWILWVV